MSLPGPGTERGQRAVRGAPASRLRPSKRPHPRSSWVDGSGERTDDAVSSTTVSGGAARDHRPWATLALAPGGGDNRCGVVQYTDRPWENAGAPPCSSGARPLVPLPQSASGGRMQSRGRLPRLPAPRSTRPQLALRIPSDHRRPGTRATMFPTPESARRPNRPFSAEVDDMTSVEHFVRQMARRAPRLTTTREESRSSSVTLSPVSAMAGGKLRRDRRRTRRAPQAHASTRVAAHQGDIGPRSRRLRKPRFQTSSSHHAPWHTLLALRGSNASTAHDVLDDLDRGVASQCAVGRDCQSHPANRRATSAAAASSLSRHQNPPAADVRHGS